MEQSDHIKIEDHIYMSIESLATRIWVLFVHALG